MEKKSRNTKSVFIEDDYTVRFYQPEKILFPNLCILCGEVTKNKKEKEINGSYNSNQLERVTLKVKFPICPKCLNLARKSKTIAKIKYSISFISLVLGLIVSILISIYIYAFLFVIAIILLSFSVPYLFYLIEVRKRLDIEESFKLESKKLKKSLLITFPHQKYAEYVYNINLNL